MKFKRILTSLIIPFYFLLPGCSQEEESISRGLIDPLSGPFANVGEHVLRLNLDVHVDSLFLVDVSIPNFNAQFLLSDGLLILNILDVAV